MALSNLIDGLTYAKGTVNQDLRNIRLAARTAVKPFEPVPLAQLEAYLSDLSTNIGTQITQEGNNRAASETTINNLIASNFSALNEAIHGVHNKETVGARVLTYGELASPVSGINYSADSGSYQRWILVDNESDTSRNGIYYQNVTTAPAPSGSGTINVYTPVRVPEWSTADSFLAGFEIFVDSGTFQNTVYWVFDNAVVGGAGGFSVGFMPWQRPEFIQIDTNADSGFLSKIGNKIRAQINDAYFQVLSGDLTWSDALVAWKATVDSGLVELASLQDTVATHTSEIENLTSTVTGQTANISGLNTQTTGLRSDLTDLQNSDTSQTARLTAIETLNSSQDGRLDSIDTTNTVRDTRLGLIEGINVDQDGHLESIDTLNGQQTSLINQLRTDVDADDARLISVEGINSTQDGRLTSIESLNGVQDTQITGLRTDTDAATTKNTAQDTRLIALESADTAQDSLITGLRTDTDASTTKNTAQDSRLTATETVNTEQNARLDSLESSDTSQYGLITGLRTDTDAATTKNTAQDSRLTSLESTSGTLVSQIATLPTTTNVNSLILGFLTSSAIRRVLTSGSSSVVDGISETTFTVDVTAEMATLGSGAAFRLMSLNDGVNPYTQSAPPVVNYPDPNTIAVTVQSISGSIADNTLEASFQAFFI